MPSGINSKHLTGLEKAHISSIKLKFNTNKKSGDSKFLGSKGKNSTQKCQFSLKKVFLTSN